MVDGEIWDDVEDAVDAAVDDGPIDDAVEEEFVNGMTVKISPFLTQTSRCALQQALFWFPQ